MFSGFMINAWLVASMVAIVAGVIGFFVVLRSEAFAAHAIPNGAFAGAAGAALIGVPAIAGLASFAVLAAGGIGWLARKGQKDVATALTLVMLLATGAAFLSRTTEYAQQIFALLFGEVLGVSSNDLLPIALLGVICVAGVAIIYRPLLFSSTVPDVAQTSGVAKGLVDAVFLLILALATAMTVPVVGTLLIFTLMIGPPAAARSLTNRPRTAIGASVLLSLVTIWTAIACSYLTNWPIGFFVGSTSAVLYGAARLWVFAHSAQVPTISTV